MCCCSATFVQWHVSGWYSNCIGDQVAVKSQLSEHRSTLVNMDSTLCTQWMKHDHKLCNRRRTILQGVCRHASWHLCGGERDRTCSLSTHTCKQTDRLARLPLLGTSDQPGGLPHCFLSEHANCCSAIHLANSCVPPALA
jgi:hypothetical protein